MLKRFFLAQVLVAMLLLFQFPAIAHNINQSYIYLKVYESSVSGRFEIAINDLNKLLETDFSNDITIEEIKKDIDRIQQYFISKSDFSSMYGQHQIKFKEPGFLATGGDLGTYLLLHFDLSSITEVPDELHVTYDIDYNKFSNHNGLLMIEYNWKAGILNNESLPSLFFSEDNTTDTVNLSDGSILNGFVGMVKQGVWHIWIGIDHILFLLALILPSVLIRSNGMPLQGDKAMSIAVPLAILNPANAAWAPVEKFRPAFIYIIKIVTFFTISHTITLGLAAFEIIVLPSRLIESVIALSIALAAYHNIQPIFKGREWIIAFAFGLFHGFGFASVLSELRAGDYLGLTLFGFNLGVEIGQIAVILVIFPILFVLRKSKSYNYILIFGSFLLIFISLYWFVERAFEYDILLGRFILDIYNSIIG